jgi:ABC-2 type transport system ATP-binding protein
MTAALDAVGLGKQYGRRSALSDCTLSIPTGRVVGLVGPNGAGKTTLLQLAVGLLEPSAGTISVLGDPPAANPATLARVGFLAQDSPVLSRVRRTTALGVVKPSVMLPARDAPALNHASSEDQT